MLTRSPAMSITSSGRSSIATGKADGDASDAPWAAAALAPDNDTARYPAPATRRRRPTCEFRILFIKAVFFLFAVALDHFCTATGPKTSGVWEALSWRVSQQGSPYFLHKQYSNRKRSDAPFDGLPRREVSTCLCNRKSISCCRRRSHIYMRRAIFHLPGNESREYHATIDREVAST